jgi:transcriptional regulator with XRE-family HTH domain
MATARRKKKPAEESLGRRLARLRKERGVTQVELAQAVDLAQSNVSDYERDVCRPNADMILKIATKLRVSTDELLGHRMNLKEGPVISRKLLRRVIEIEKLPRRDQQALLRTIDAFLAKSA